MDKHRIETRAREVLGEVIKHQASIFNDGLPYDHFDFFTPEAAAAVCGLTLHRAGSLGDYRDAQGRLFRVAGFLDPRERVAYASRDFKPYNQDFTLLHEVGHADLHNLAQPHRDRPLGKLDDSYTRSPEDREADYFAAAYRIPRRVLQAEFELRFGKAPLRFDENVSYHLAPKDHVSLLRPHKGSSARAVALAGCRAFNGRHFMSLAERFRVTIPVMAYRLEDVGLFRGWP